VLLALGIFGHEFYQRYTAKPNNFLVIDAGCCHRSWKNVIFEDRTQVAYYVKILKRGEYGIFMFRSDEARVDTSSYRLDALQ